MKHLQALSLLLLAGLLAACTPSYQNIPPNDIGMMLTPSGYEDKIYTPGQVDIGDLGGSGQGNRLILIQRSGIQVKESFIGPAASEDKEDHRCLTSDKAPMTLDVRLLFALPDYNTPEGKKDLERIFLLGNPKPIEGAASDRVQWISAQSIYVEQAQQAVRGKIRQLCAGFADFDAAYASFRDESENGFIRKIEKAVADVLQKTRIPLRLVNAYASNMKPDQSVIDAISAQQAAEKRTRAMQTLTDFIGHDEGRQMVYQMQVMQEITARANANGHSTIILGPGASLSPLPRN